MGPMARSKTNAVIDRHDIALRGGGGEAEGGGRGYLNEGGWHAGCTALKSFGFILTARKGSHRCYRHFDAPSFRLAA